MIFYIIFIVLLCLILSIAAPLRVYAVGEALGASWSIIEEIIALMGGFAGSVIAVEIGVPVLVAILISFGVSFTAVQIHHALQQSLENGAWDSFIYMCQDISIKKLVDGYVVSSPVGLFPDVIDWVKTNIIGYYDEVEYIDTDFQTVTPTPHFYLNDYLHPGEALTAPDGYWRGVPYASVSANYSLQPLSRYGMLIDQGIDFSGAPFKGSLGLLEKNGFKLSYNTNATDFFTSDSCIMLSLQVNKHLTFHFGQSAYTGEGPACYAFTLPAVCSDNGNNNFMRFGCFVYKAGQTSSGENMLYYKSEFSLNNDKYSYIQIDDKLYRVSSKDWGYDGIVYEDSDGNKYLVNSVLNGEKSGVIRQDTILFNSAFLGADVTVNDYSKAQTEQKKVTAAAPATEVRSNPYYDTKKDVISKIADTVHQKTKSGELDDVTAATGVISLTVADTDTVTGADVSEATKIGDIAAVSDIAVSDTISEAGINVDVSTTLILCSNDLRVTLSGIGDRFPFSTISSINKFFSKLSFLNGKAPVIPVKVNLGAIKYNTSIDFSFLNSYIDIVQDFIVITYVISLYAVVRKWFISKGIGGV